MGSPATWVDAGAPSDHDYRYAAVVVGARGPAGGIAEQGVASDPSPEVRVTDIAASIRLKGPETEYDSSFMLNGFIPSSYVAPANAESAPTFFRPGLTRKRSITIPIAFGKMRTNMVRGF